jgi:hypothetical protein
MGLSLDDMSDHAVPLTPAVLFGLFGLSGLAVAIRLGMGRATAAPQIESEAGRWPRGSILQLSVLLIVVGHVLDNVQYMFGGAQQIIVALANVKWAGLFLLAYWVLSNRQGYGWLAVILVIEIMLGMTGFFAEFRIVLFVALAAAISARTQLRLSNVLLAGILTVVMLFTAVFWSAVKQDYRDYLNRGSGAQIVLQSLEDRISYIGAKASTFSSEEFAYGFERLLERLSYVDYLSVTIANVPTAIPHENGIRLGSAIWHVLTPRIFFPNKPPTPLDTEATAYYTGLKLDMSYDTSISIGWLGELYIDLGFSGAIAVTALLGLLYGRAYRALCDRRGPSRLINLALCATVALPLASFGTALIKMIGSVVISFAAAWALQRFIFPHLRSWGPSRSLPIAGVNSN